MSERQKRIQQLVCLVLEIRRAVGVYLAPDVETLVSELEDGITELTAPTGDNTDSTSLSNSEDKTGGHGVDPQEESFGKLFILRNLPDYGTFSLKSVAVIII